MRFVSALTGRTNPALLRRAFAVAATCLLAAGLNGCGAVNGGAGNVAQLRIIDASPSAGGLDIYANNAALTYNLGFGTVTSYVPASPGTYTLAAVESGTKTTVASSRATMQNAKQYTLLISNLAASQQAQVLTDQSQPAPSGQIALRFLDESTAAGPVDIYLVPQGSKVTDVGALSTGLVYGSNTGYLNVPGGTYSIYIAKSGTVVGSTTVPLYTGPSNSYPYGSARTILLLNQQILTNPGVQVVTADDYESAAAAASTN